MTRKYPCSGLALLIAASTLAGNFEAEKAAFIQESAMWDDPYIENYKSAIELILTTVYGIDTKQDQKEATRNVVSITKSSKDDLVMVKEQIERGYRDDTDTRDVLLDKLGYKSLWKNASRGTQEAVIALLVKFRNNLSESDQAELVAKGVSSARIDRILENASSLAVANDGQETLKFSSKQGTEEHIKKLNAIYEQAMDICTIGQRLFKGDQLKRESFTFSRILAMQSRTVSDDNGEATTEE
jgi:uncharacterized protein YaaW (UPF0174 family)